MAWKPKGGQKQVSELLGVLNNAKVQQENPALYQVVSGLITRLSEVKGTGEQGEKGEDGEDGAGLEIKGTVPTFAELPLKGEPGDIWITADTGHLWAWDKTTGTWIDLGLMQGPQGPPGETGPPGTGSPGPQGPVGPKGAKGDTGNTGPQGPPGTTGPQGVPGPTGNTGPIGPIGPQGVKGDKGDTGSQGVPGIQGIQGEQGIPGPIGPEGPEGQPGTGIAIQGSVPSSADLPLSGNTEGDAWITADTGHLWVWDGTQWVDAGLIQGSDGPQGPQGPQGIQGPQGVEGPQGIPGQDGADGESAGPHHITHEPGGSDALVNAAWTNLTNQFTTFQQIGPGPVGANPYLRIIDSTGEGARIFFRDTTSPNPENGQIAALRFQAGSLRFQILNTATEGEYSGWEFANNLLFLRGPAGLPPRIAFYTNGGDYLSSPTIQALIDNTTLLLTSLNGVGRKILLAAGFGDTPLDASQLLSGLIPDARLSINVLKHSGGFPGGITNFLRADGTFAVPPSSGGGGGNPFDQSLNTTDDVTFDDVSVEGNLQLTGGSPVIEVITEGEDLAIRTASSVGKSGDISFVAGSSSLDDAGDIEIVGGISSTLAGGDVDIRGGEGGETGGAVTIEAGAGAPGSGGWLNLKSPEKIQIVAPKIELQASTHLLINTHSLTLTDDVTLPDDIVPGPIGPQGPQGIKGDTGDTGAQGPQGIQGIQGEQGIQGIEGPQGDVGPEGPQGEAAPSSSVFPYRADTASQQVQDPGAGKMRWNNVVQSASTLLVFDWLTADGFDVHVLFESTPPASRLIIHDEDLATTHQEWRIDGVIPATDWFAVQVTFISQDGPGGDGSMVNNKRCSVLVLTEGATGPQGPQGEKGDTGDTGPQGIQGPQGPQGIQGIQGVDGGITPHHTRHEPGGSDAITALAGEVITTGTVADARLSANVALKNIDNNFVAQTLADGTTIAGNNHYLGFRSNPAGVDQKNWRMLQYGDGMFRLEALNDALSAVTADFYFRRDGTFQSNKIQATTLFYGPNYQFPAASVPNRTVDPNTLDDYQEQTFLPVISGDSGAGVVYGFRNGIAVKIGGMVYISGGLNLSSKGTWTGNVYLSGFPWACSNIANTGGLISYFSGLLTSVTQLTLVMVPNAPYGVLHFVPAAGATGVTALTFANITNNLDIRYHISYPAAGV